MMDYVARRLAAVALLLVGMSILVFLILRLIPGDPAVVMLGTNAGSEAMVRNLHHQLGLDKPLVVQYITWAAGLLHGDLGYSYDHGMPVTTLIADNLPYTVELTVAGLGISVIGGVIIGVIAALNRNSLLDTVIMGIALVGTSLPIFWLGLLLILVFAVEIHWFPVFGGTSLKGLVLPAVSLGISGAGFTARFVRSAVINSLRQQYVVTARSKGLYRRQVVLLHVLRNSILPILTIVGLQFGNLLSGAVIIETVFSRPGIGRELVEGILNKDYLVVQGIVFLVAFLYIMSNLAVDLLYPVFDPRISH
jgi:ABC-type dipeptide/oligopeptide/nickel transport system permease component